MRTAPLVAVTAALGAVLGLGIAEAVDADLDDARRVATALVPPGAEVVEVFEYGDFPLLGRTAFVRVNAEGATQAQLRARLPQAGVGGVRVQEWPGGTQLRGSRGRVEVLVTALPPSSLSITATPTGPSRTLWALLGAVLVPVTAVVWRRTRRRSDRPAVAAPALDGQGPEGRGRD